MDLDGLDAGLDRETVAGWVARYERAWRSPGTEALAGLFAADAAYRMSPYEEPAEGLEEIAALWERERAGPDERFEMASEVVAVEGDTAVVRVAVSYGSGAEYRDLWVIRLDAEGRCRAFEEWPFWPGRPVADERAAGR
jgi:ketosteroid isomerase-like protein